MGKKKKVPKEYRLNLDTMDYNDRKLFGSDELEIESEYHRENPKTLYRKGTFAGGVDTNYNNNKKYSKK